MHSLMLRTDLQCLATAPAAKAQAAGQTMQTIQEVYGVQPSCFASAGQGAHQLACAGRASVVEQH